MQDQIFPVHEVIPELKEKLALHPLVILQAPPGAGKSTILPAALMNETFLKGKKIIMLEPRRLAARSVAQRMADLAEEPCGETIGYKIRFENKCGKNTRIEVVTEGILTRLLQEDNALEEYGLVIFDEFHERNLNSDLSLALCTQCQQVLRPDLKILIMSATLDTELISKAFNKAPVVSSQGRQYPVTIIYTKEHLEQAIPQGVYTLIKKALTEQQGDLLVFLPGVGEIHKTAELLENAGTNALVYPLYGDLNFELQQKAILPDKNKRRKIILSTSIAETSLTIEGITTVIDSGYSRSNRFDTRSGLSKLETHKVSKDTADQRAGRAGRLGPGVCYRLWTEGMHQHLPAARTAEILEADLSPLMLELLNWGVKEVSELNWVTTPPAANVAQAMDLLSKLEAAEDGKISSTGKKLLRFPTHPRIAHMFLTALEKEKKQAGICTLAADIAAILEERDPLDKNAGTDLQLRLDALSKFRKKDAHSGDKRILERIERLSHSWRKLLKTEKIAEGDKQNIAGELLMSAYPERVCKQAEKNKGLYRLANGRNVRLQDHDALMHEEWIVAAQLDTASREGKIFLAAGLDPAAITPHAKKVIRTEWDSREGKLIATENLVYEQLNISVKVLRDIAEEQKAAIICEALKKEGLQKFGWNADCVKWQARVQSICKWNPEEEWPDVREEHLLLTAENWLPQWLGKATSLEEIKKLNWKDIAENILNWEQQQLLNELCPEKISVPSGSAIQLDYFSDGKAPELHVRLQEVFGMQETPTINKGKNKIVLHLLSPGYKPVQVTMDLKSFWNNAYHEVRKELQRRYPKHSWPENPLEAEAVRGVKRK